MLCAVADVHLGNHRIFGGPLVAGLNRRCRETLAVLTAAAQRAKELRAPLFILGDLFDTARPEPQIIAAAQAALGGVDCYALLGNHEMVSTAAGDHALGPLHEHNMIEVIDRPRWVGCGELDVLCVPFRPGDAREWLPAVVGEMVAAYGGVGQRVLMLHLGIIDGSTAPWLKAAHNAVPLELLTCLAEEHTLCYVLAGDWHERRVLPEKALAPWAMQVGALAPTGWDNAGMDGYGTLATVCPREGLRHEVLPGPRFLKLKAGAALPAAKGCQLYVRVMADADKLDEARQHGAALVEQGVLAGFEAAPDDKEVQAATRAAAGAAKSAETMDQALDGYVREMPLDDGVDREAVLARCRAFLGGAA